MKLSPVAQRILRIMGRFSSLTESCDPERLMEWGRGESNSLNSLIDKQFIEQVSYRGYRITQLGRDYLKETPR